MTRDTKLQPWQLHSLNITKAVSQSEWRLRKLRMEAVAADAAFGRILCIKTRKVLHGGFLHDTVSVLNTTSD